jgi:galactoside O-acetyltransferase
MFLTRNEVLRLGFKKVGVNVLISDKASFHGAKYISLGDHVRIDDYAVLSAGEMIIGNFVHIATHVIMVGHALIQLDDFVGVSFGSVIMSSSDDYSGEWMTNPMIDDKYKFTTHAPVVLCKHALIGSSSVVMPGVSMGIGSVAGAGSFVKRSMGAFEVWGGNPLRFIKERKTDILDLEKQILHG